MRVELLLAPDCPNAAAAKTALSEALDELELRIAVQERVGDYPSPTVLVDGIDVMNDCTDLPAVQACRLDVPTVPRLLAALRRRVAEG